MSIWSCIMIAGLFITPIALIGAAILAYRRHQAWRKLQRVAMVGLGLMIFSLVVNSF